MKNYLFSFVSSIFLLLLFGSCQKEHQIEQNNSQISLKDAEKIGSELFNSVNNKNEKKASSKLNHQNLSVKSTQTINSKSGKNLYYVINYAPEGFSIVSATKNYKDKILAFSPNGSFDINIARKTLGVDNWLQNVDSMINTVVDQPYNESNHFKSSTMTTNAVNNVALC